MKKIVSIATTALMVVFAVSCGNKSKKDVASVGIEAYSDSVYMINDSTIGEVQTYVYEGILPTEEGIPANYVLTINSYGLNEDGTYSLTESYTETNGMTRTNQDKGEKIVFVGMPNAPTAIIYELISYNNRPILRLVAEGDSALHKIDKDLKRVTNDIRHKLRRH